MKILIVDDHILFREGLVGLLRNQSRLSIVGEAGTVHEAVKKTLEFNPDLVLIDLNLPDGSGLEVMQAIHSQRPDTLFVVLTSYYTEELLIASIHHGAVGFLLKNTSASKLIQTLHAVERGEAALSRTMTRRVVEEFQRIVKLARSVKYDLSILTERELQILKLLGMGSSNQEIAASLVIAENTVKTHIHNILNKLNLRNRREAGEFARRYNINPPIPNHLNSDS